MVNKTSCSRKVNNSIFFIAEYVCTDIKIVTKKWGSENSWTFGSCSSAQTYGSRQVYTEECCQLSGDYQLVCKDSYGDGWHGGYIQIGGTGKKYCKRFRNGHEETTEATMSGKLYYVVYLLSDLWCYSTNGNLFFTRIYIIDLYLFKT